MALGSSQCGGHPTNLGVGRARAYLVLIIMALRSAMLHQRV